MAEQKKYFTPEQLEAWKKEHFGVVRITTKDGLVAILRDPIADLLVMKLAFNALKSKDLAEVAKIIISNCWLAGDDIIKTSNKHLLGIKDKLNQLVDPPECTITETENGCLELECEGKKLTVRKAEREDINRAEMLNQAGEHFETAIHLFNIVKLSLDQLDDVRTNPRAYMGMLTKVEEIKDIVTATVEKL